MIEELEFWNSRRYLEGCCLEALRCDRDKWSPRMSPDLFSGMRKDIFHAIMQAGDPTDPVQVAHVVDKQGVYTELAEIIDYTIAVPMRDDEQISYRLGQLMRMFHRERLGDLLANSQASLEADTAPDEIRQYLETNLTAISATGVLGPFENAKTLDDAVEDEKEVESIVRSVLYPGGVSTIVGAGGLGKSWLAIWLGLCIARGDFWLGMQTKEPKRVGYMCLEMPGVAIRHRIKKLTSGKYPQEARERFCYTGLEDTGRAVDVLNESFRMSLATWVAERELDVLIVDPLRNTHTVNEDKSTEMGNVLRAFSSLGCSVLLVHHVTESTGKSRGSTAIRDWCDTVLNLSQREDNSLWLGWEKRPRFAAVGGDMEVLIGATRDGMVVQRAEKGDPWREEETQNGRDGQGDQESMAL